MRVLGIDPGSLKAGFGIVEHGPQGIKHIAHGTIVLSNKFSLEERLRDLAKDIEAIVHKYSPTCAVIEEAFFFKNPKAALVLGQARGIAIGVLSLNNIPISSLSPTAVKSRIIGHGHAKKFQVAAIISHQLNIPIPTSQDASDALALAVCFI